VGRGFIDSYGWQPSPEQFPPLNFEARWTHQAISMDENAVLDENAVPPGTMFSLGQVILFDMVAHRRHKQRK
jgi:hypothetical protein